MTAWLSGASGAWGGAVALDLLRRGHDVVALGRRDVPALRAWAARAERGWSFVPFDLGAPDLASIPTDPPDVLVHAAVSMDGGRDALVQANFLSPAALIEVVIAGMRRRGHGRVGVFLAQNARLGLAGLGDPSASQAALWTWCEAVQEELRRDGAKVTLTRVIPPRTASPTQRAVAERSGRSARLHRPDARGLVEAILAGKRRAGRRPVLAAVSLMIRG